MSRFSPLSTRSFATLTLCALLVAIFSVAVTPSPAFAASESTARQKTQAENQRASVEKRLSDMQKRLSEREAENEAATEALKKADQAISDANRKLRTLRTERSKVEKRLSELRADNRTVGRDLKSSEETLEQITRARFIHAQRNAWQHIIDGGNPNDLARTAAELRYLALTQARTAEALEAERSRIRSVSQEVQARRTELSRIAAEEEVNRSRLVKEKQERQSAVKRLSRDIANQQAAIEKLRKDQARLENLVAQIDARLAKERAAEEVARKQEIARREAAAKKRNSSAQSNTATVTAPSSSTGFARLRGRLTRPVSGKIAATFGSNRSGTASWQGILFRVAEGADVAACAAGRVVFSDWLRGYGNLIIVDHGDTYMSVYANNESLLKNTGDRVKAGETIATAGASGATDEPGLYFELRYKGKPINPQPWLGK